MNPAAISGIHQLAQVYNWLAGLSLKVPSDTVGNAVQNRSRTDSRLCVDTFGHILSFLEPQDLACSERVCKTWNSFICEAGQWKIQCQMQLGLSAEIDPMQLGLSAEIDPMQLDLSAEIDPKKYLPEGLSYKKSIQLMSANILDKRVYELYIGKIGPVPPIPEGISLKKWNEPDPCDLTKTIGENYVWMYCPSYIEISLPGFSLDKADDPNASEAPKLIRIKEGLEAQSKQTVLNVPVTINNIEELFKCPKTGNPSKYSHMNNATVKQHGNKRIPAGWICMRRDVIGRGLRFDQQQELANEKGVVLSELLPRILFNFLEHVRSKKVNVYPDGTAPYTYARTSTLTHDLYDNTRPSACGAGGPSGLRVNDYGLIDDGRVGVSVALPAEVQVLGF